MSDTQNDTDLKPSDHILDAFMHELGAATTWDHARKFLADLREAFGREESAPRPVIGAGSAANARPEAEVKAEALREAADATNWAKVMSPYRALRERADELDSPRSDARPGWLQKMAGDLNARQATPEQLAAEIVDLAHTYDVPTALVMICEAFDRRNP